MNDIQYRRFDNKLASLKPFINAVATDLKLNKVRPLTVQIDAYDFWNPDHGGRTSHHLKEYDWFKIELNTEVGVIKLKEVIAHELRHVYQNVFDKYNGRGYHKSLENSYTQDQFNNYVNSPDEVDARDYASKFIIKWNKRRK